MQLTFEVMQGLEYSRRTVQVDLPPVLVSHDVHQDPEDFLLDERINHTDVLTLLRKVLVHGNSHHQSTHQEVHALGVTDLRIEVGVRRQDIL